VAVRPGLVILLLGWLAGWWLLARMPRLRTPGDPPGQRRGAEDVAPDDVALGDVSVVIPARNEADNLPGLLSSLADQQPPPAQVIVVDDGSTDGTAEVARSFGVIVVDSSPLPDGWTGKSWACMQGADLASGDTLVFLDADTRLLPGGLAAVVEEQRRRGGLLSVQPYHRMARAYERLSAVFNVIAVMGVGVGSPGRAGRARGAFGPCIVCRAEDYRRVGGHGAVADEILEDLALGRVFAEGGDDVWGAGGRGVIEFRMYPGGPAQLIEGWSKNMASGSASIGALRLVATILWVCGAVGSSAELVQWLGGIGSATTVEVWVAWAAYALQFGVMLRQLGNFGLWPTLAYPVTFAAFVLVFFDSLWLTVVRRRVRWRGRTVPLPSRRGASRRTREP